jgi:hypothetical protein
MADEKKKFDIEKFNTDPLFESERNQFDQMFAGAILRFEAKKKLDAPEDDNFFDRIFGKKKED